MSGLAHLGWGFTRLGSPIKSGFVSLSCSDVVPSFHMTWNIPYRQWLRDWFSLTRSFQHGVGRVSLGIPVLSPEVTASQGLLLLGIGTMAPVLQPWELCVVTPSS